MDTELLKQPVQLAFLGGGLIVFLGYFLQLSANLCGADAPSFRKSVVIGLLTALAAFLTYDLSGYAIFLASRDAGPTLVPDGLSYVDWLRMSLAVKWEMLNVVPGVRYLPLLFAVCLAGIVYVLVLKVPYRISMVVFFLQWTLSIVSLAVLSFVLTTTLNFLGLKPAPDPSAASHPQARVLPPGPPFPRQPPRQANQAQANQQGQSGEVVGWLKRQSDSIRQTLDPYLDPIREASRPYTMHLPVIVQVFLDDGGWWLVILALAVVAWFWARGLYRRVKRILFSKKKRRKKVKDSPMRVLLREVGDALTEEGPVQATVREMPVRLRVVVVAPGVTYLGELLPEMAESLLDYVKPGLADVLESDVPRVVVWPRQPSEDRFQQLFFGNMEVPEPRGRRSHWVLLAGTIRLGRQKVHLGLAAYAEQASLLREVRIDKENWEPVLGLQPTEERV